MAASIKGPGTILDIDHSGSAALFEKTSELTEIMKNRAAESFEKINTLADTASNSFAKIDDLIKAVRANDTALLYELTELSQTNLSLFEKTEELTKTIKESVSAWTYYVQLLISLLLVDILLQMWNAYQASHLTP